MALGLRYQEAPHWGTKAYSAGSLAFPAVLGNLRRAGGPEYRVWLES